LTLRSETAPAAPTGANPAPNQAQAPAPSGDAPTPTTAAEPADAAALAHERPAPRFERTVALPFPVQADAVRARLKHGLLWIELPRAENDKPRRIPVETAA
ncbi:MAG: Hsp20/alpha crystallin family protein, partial [Planctomycetota bacterium]